MNDEMLKDFIIEAIDLLEESEKALLILEDGGSFSEQYKAIFRAFHSVKGAAGMFEIEALQSHMHFLENLLESKKSNENLSSKSISYFLAAIDVAKKMVHGEVCKFNLFDPDLEKNNDKLEANSKHTPKSKIVKNEPLIYVIDDEIIIAEMIESYLKTEKYNVEKFSDVDILLNTLKKRPCDLIIADYLMPKMNGIEMMKKISIDFPMLPFILVSAYFDKSSCLDAISLGVSGMIEKPFMPEQISTMVRKSLAKYQTFKLLNKGVDILIYQFKNFENKLDKEDKALIEEQLKYILEKKRLIIQNYIR